MLEDLSHVEMLKELENAASKVRIREDKSLTEAEMIGRAKEIASACDWIWLEPVEVIAHRNWLSKTVSYYEVATNTNCKGLNISVYFDPSNGAVFKCAYAQR